MKGVAPVVLWIVHKVEVGQNGVPRPRVVGALFRNDIGNHPVVTLHLAISLRVKGGGPCLVYS